MRDHSSGCSRGFTFESDQCVDDILKDGNMLDFAGTQVEIKKAEPKKPSRRQTNPRVPFGGGHRDIYGGYDGGFGGGNFGGCSYRSGGVYGSRASEYGGPEFHGYGGYGGVGYGGGAAGYGGGGGSFRMDSPVGYSNHFGGGFGRGYDIGSEFAGPGDRNAGYGSSGYRGGYDAGFDDGPVLETDVGVRFMEQRRLRWCWWEWKVPSLRKVGAICDIQVAGLDDRI